MNCNNYFSSAKIMKCSAKSVNEEENEVTKYQAIRGKCWNINLEFLRICCVSRRCLCVVHTTCVCVCGVAESRARRGARWLQCHLSQRNQNDGLVIRSGLEWKYNFFFCQRHSQTMAYRNCTHITRSAMVLRIRQMCVATKKNEYQKIGAVNWPIGWCSGMSFEEQIRWTISGLLAVICLHWWRYLWAPFFFTCFHEYHIKLNHAQHRAHSIWCIIILNMRIYWTIMWR